MTHTRTFFSYKNSCIDLFLSPTNVTQAARFILSLEDTSFKKEDLHRGNKLREALRDALHGYSEPYSSSLRHSWILQVEDAVAELLHLVRVLYPLLTPVTALELVSLMESPHHSPVNLRWPEKYERGRSLASTHA
jgi:hypothetical protein